MAQRTVTYAVCGGQQGTCGRELRTPGEGFVFYGPVYRTGPQQKDDAPLLEAEPNQRTRRLVTPIALCWDCFRALAPDPLLVELQRAEDDRARTTTTRPEGSAQAPR